MTINTQQNPVDPHQERKRGAQLQRRLREGEHGAEGTDYRDDREQQAEDEMGLARAAVKVGMANMVYTMKRLVFLDRLATA